MLFDPMILLEQPLAVLGALAIIVLGKSIAARLLVTLLGHLAAHRADHLRQPGADWRIRFYPRRTGDFARHAER